MNEEEQLKYLQNKLEKLAKQESKRETLTPEEQRADMESEITFEAYARMMDDINAAEQRDREAANEDYDEARYKEELAILKNLEQEESARK